MMSESLFRTLLDSYLDGTLDGQGEQQLFEALEQPLYSRLLAEIMDEQIAGQEKDQNDYPETFSRIQAYVMVNKNKEQKEEITESARVVVMEKPAERKRWIGWVAAAAITGLVVFGGLQLFKKDTVQPADTIASVQDVEPGKPGAILKLSDGRQVLLDTAGNGNILQDFTKGEGTLTVAGAGVEYATLETPKGRTMQLTLADGTLVWLDAGSSIRFPTSFTQGTRNVSITGQAYFEVAKNAKQPFIVETRTDKIEVLGTHFNINAYENEGMVRTTLLEGSVKVGNAILKPNERYENGKTTSISESEADESIAWKNGQIAFRDASLAQILREIERWYDVDVEVKGQLPQSGSYYFSVGRNSKLSELLRAFEVVYHIPYRIEGEGDKKKLVVNP